MNISIRFAFPLLILAACATAPPPASAPAAPPQPPVDPAATAFDFDSAAIQQAPAAALPAERLTLKAFDQAHVASKLLKTTERFEVQESAGSHVLSVSPTWSIELDPHAGRVLALRNEAAGKATQVQPEELEKLALARLADFGITPAEIERVLQRRVDKQALDDDGSTPTPPEVFRYKTFVMRGINGVPIVGNRAVVSYAADGDFQRTLVHWPALAGQGHRLRTRLTAQQIEERARTALAREGERTGHVVLRWMYRPVLQPSGEVVLTLVVGAGLGTVTTEGLTEEPRIVDVDVDATE